MKDSTRRDRVSGRKGIPLAFAPWIAYWTLSGMGYWTAAHASGLALAGALVAYRIVVSRPKLMEAVSVVFFASALASTLLQSQLFVVWGSLLGYGTLAAMAFGSVIARSPFIAQYIRDDWPSEYWGNSVFLATNSLISGIWGSVFLSAGALHLPVLALSGVPRLLATHGLVIFGIVASVLLSRWFPRWAISRRTLKVRYRYGGTWSAPSMAVRRNGGRGYDVIIVGSGIGGLTCGALLATRGVKVLVLEQHAVVGGFCHSFVRGHRRYRFDAAVHDISGLGPRGPVRYLLRRLGIEDRLEFLRMDHEYILPDVRLRIPRDPLAFQAALGQRFPQEAEKISAFFREVEAIYREIYQDVELTGGVPRPPEDVDALLEYPKTHPHHVRWLDKSYQEMLDAYFTDENLKRFFSVLTGYIGGPASHVPAALTAIIFGGYYLDGGYYPKGGSQVFADALAQVIIEHGGAVRTSALVKRILVEGKKVTGVELARGEIVGAPIVVSNADLKQTFLGLLGSEQLDSAFTRYISGLRMSTTAVSVFLGIDFAPDLAPLTFYLSDPPLYLAVPSLVDPSLAPADHHVLSLGTLVPSSRARYLFERPGYRKSPEYKAWKAAMAEALIGQAEKILPGLTSHVVIKDAATALTFERYALASEGAIYGIDQSPDQMGEYRPHFKTPIRGLYLAGASTFPGAGIEAVVISGVIAADDICPAGLAAVPSREAA